MAVQSTLTKSTLVLKYVDGVAVNGKDITKTSTTLSVVRDGLTETEIAATMDVVIASNVFNSSGGDLVAKSSA